MNGAMLLCRIGVRANPVPGVSCSRKAGGGGGVGVQRVLENSSAHKNDRQLCEIKDSECAKDFLLDV